jgi:peptidoglycan/LPS O-acetylase OafA/YrhL
MERPTRPWLEAGRIPELDGLRAMSILLVLATHLLPLGPKAWSLNAMAGAMGMSLFFALSGFLIIRSLAASRVQDFIIRRLARLVPLAWLYLGIVFLIYPLSGDGLLAGLGFFLNYRPELMLPQTEHLWSLGVEVHFYAAVALLMLVHRRAVLLVWLLCGAVTAFRIAEGAHLSIVTHLRVDEILAGACVATLSRTGLARMPGAARIWFLALAAWCIASHPASGWLQFLRPYVTAWLLIATLNLPEGSVRDALSARAPRYIATISYALYVIHPITAHGWWSAGTLMEKYLFKRPMGILITFALAHLSTFYWEHFWTRAARRWLKPAQGPAVPATQPKVAATTRMAQGEAMTGDPRAGAGIT